MKRATRDTADRMPLGSTPESGPCLAWTEFPMLENKFQLDPYSTLHSKQTKQAEFFIQFPVRNAVGENSHSIVQVADSQGLSLGEILQEINGLAAKNYTMHSEVRHRNNNERNAFWMGDVAVCNICHQLGV